MNWCLIVIGVIFVIGFLAGLLLSVDRDVDNDGRFIAGLTSFISLILGFLLVAYAIYNPINNNIPSEYSFICYEINNELTNREVGQILNLTYLRYTDEEIVCLLNPYLSESQVKEYVNQLSEARE